VTISPSADVPKEPVLVALVDTTLREGQQHGLVSFTVDSAVRIARLLDAFGVNIIEVGHPAVSRHDMAIAKAVSSVGLSAQTLAHARATPSDIAAAVACGAQWAGVFAGINDLSIRHKLHRPVRQVLRCIRDAVTQAKDSGLHVRFTTEDASRTPPSLVADAFEAAIRAGEDRVSYADTVGVTTPSTMRSAVESLTKTFGPIVHAHCHNDFGLASANALAAYEGGAVALDVSVDGIGERSGIARLAEVACALVQIYHVPASWHLSMLVEISMQVRAMCPEAAVDTRPIVGKYAFAHKAGIHIAAEVENQTAYEPLLPKSIGHNRKFVLGRLTGLDAARAVMKMIGMEAHDNVVAQLVRALKTHNQTFEIRCYEDEEG
jgi:isopropylmalate/homocitrate/citramalate synthase